MTYLVARVIRTKWLLHNGPQATRGIPRPFLCIPMYFSTCGCCGQRVVKENRISDRGENGRGHIDGRKIDEDPRINDLGRAIEDDYATIRQNYATPKNPIVLAHGLLGFDELRLAGNLLPGVQYWRGITEAMRANGIEVILTSVPASASIEERAAKLSQDIATKANGKSVNIIAHSMGGLDARYMISRLKPDNVNVLSLTTIATPHRGSYFADYTLNEIGPKYLGQIYKVIQNIGYSTGAFSQLTQKYMQEEFNPNTPDKEGVRYFSYGATADPGLMSAFRRPHRIVEEMEGPNDGLVSVESAKWGTYKGTLVGVSHLDLINWSNRLRSWFWHVGGYKKKFNAVAFYLDIVDMLAKEDL
ncbi:alpha/beta-hydrolase [Acephala macrosclerotiorum]|nr:alpha/beta-hydrolase [Acephala macrosclerotiorum]